MVGKGIERQANISMIAVLRNWLLTTNAVGLDSSFDYVAVQISPMVVQTGRSWTD